jgi:outer membrane beta-barrel protein
MRRRVGPWLVAVLLAWAAPVAAQVAGESGEEGAPRVVQNRKHVMSHELSLGVGTVPIDPYYKGLTGTFSYTVHGTNWGWEVVSFTYARDFWTSLRDDLEHNWRQPGSPKVPEMQFLGDSNLVWKPLYGKLAYLNRSLLYGEFYAVLGAAGAKYTETNYYVGGDVGFGFRVHLSERISTRLDFRYYRFQRLEKAADNDNVLFINLGLSLNLGR